MANIRMDLYKSIYDQQIPNHKASLYWIYDIQNIITKEQGISKRFIKVLFFNKLMNENNNLMRLYLKVNTKLLEQNQFQTVSQYENDSIMGFLIEIDLIDDKKDVEICGYVIDGKHVDVQDDLFVMPKFVNNQKKLDALKDFYMSNSDDVHVYPHVDELGWFCYCGYYSANDEVVCPICAKKKDDIIQTLSLPIDQLVLTKLMDKIKVTTDITIDELIKYYEKTLLEKYGIESNKVIGYIDKPILLNEQKYLIDKKITDYITLNPIKFNFNITFETNLDIYCSSITNSVITKDAVLKLLNKDTLEREFVSQNREYKKASQKRKKIIIATTSVALVFALGYFAYEVIFKDVYQGVSIQNTPKFRAQACSGKIKEYNFKNDSLKEMVIENNLCDFEVTDQTIPKNNIEKDGENKEVIALDEEHVLVSETSTISDNEKKVSFYIADLNKNITVDLRNSSYYLESYDGERIMKSSVYSDNLEVFSYTWEYEDDHNYTIKEFLQDKQLSNVYIFINDKLSEIVGYDTWSENNQKITLGNVSYNSEGDISEIIYKDINSNTVTQRITYENNKMKESYSFDDGEQTYQRQYLYDKNGLMLKVETFNFNTSSSSSMIYNYDFKRGELYPALFDDNQISSLSFIYKISFVPRYADINGINPIFANSPWIYNEPFDY